ncbi:MAG TPA: RecX family transcriptional regulator [Firmicutes bacterium]|jgi:SOS response regulatory protein OraA/RecX|nr:RecX family transcriptional regulator [Bacillota bacterium]
MKTKPTPMEQALAFLSRKDYTCLGMTAALTKKGYTETEIRVVVEKLTDWGYLNDRAYAAAEIERLKLDGKSRAFIRHRLETAGVAPVIIATEIERAYPQEEEEKILRAWWQKFRERLEGRAPTGRERLKWARKLLSAGFPSESVEACFEKDQDS